MEPTQSSNSISEQQLVEAYAVLYQIVSTIDPDTGIVTSRKVETPLYRDYLANQEVYNNAKLAYSEAYREAQKTGIGRNTWPMLASTLQLPVQKAYDKLRSGSADRIEQALAITKTHSHLSQSTTDKQ